MFNLLSIPIIRIFINAGSGFALVYLLRAILRRIALANLDGPRSTSLMWGNEWQLASSAPGQIFLEWAQQYGNAYKYRGAFGRKKVVLTDPTGVDYVLHPAHVYDYPKPAGGRQWFKLLLGEGLLWAEGPAHDQQRRMLAPAFNQQALRDLSSIFYDSANKAAERWNNVIDSNPADTALIDVQYWTNRISLDSIGLAGFSYDFQALSGQDHPLAKCLDKLTDSSGSFASFVVRAVLFTFPVILKAPIKRIQLVKMARVHLAEITSEMWREAMASGERGEAGRTILELLVKADLAQGENSIGEDGITAEIMTLIFAGYETTSCILSWALYELALQPLLQDRLRAEVSESNSDPTFDELHQELPLLNAVVNETLRLHPPVAELNRVAEKDDLIPLAAESRTGDHHVHIPRGTLICIPVGVMQQDPRIWGNDANVFRPERWIEIHEEGKRDREKHIVGPHRKELMAFSSGARMCIGKTFAIIEIKAVLVTLLKQFSFAPAAQIEPFVSFVVRPRVVGEKRSTLPLIVSKVKW